MAKHKEKQKQVKKKSRSGKKSSEKAKKPKTDGKNDNPKKSVGRPKKDAGTSANTTESENDARSDPEPSKPQNKRKDNSKFMKDVESLPNKRIRQSVCLFSDYLLLFTIRLTLLLRKSPLATTVTA